MRNEKREDSTWPHTQPHCISTCTHTPTEPNVSKWNTYIKNTHSSTIQGAKAKVLSKGKRKRVTFV